MSDKVKIHQIAKRIGITSTELLEICQRSGYPHIKHHSNAVSPDEAEDIRKTAIKKYKPKEQPVQKKAKPKQPPVEAKKPESAPMKKAAPVVVHDVPVPPPKPKGKASAAGRPAAVVKKVEKPERAEPRTKRAREPEPKVEAGAPKHGRLTKRTVVFKAFKKPPIKKKEERIQMTLPVTVRDLSERLGVPAGDIIKGLMLKHNLHASINEAIEEEIVQLVGVEHDVEITFERAETAAGLLLKSLPQDRPEQLRQRPPVVALLGHVDHGKTSILDRIRHTKVAESETGGITQDIGAWQMTHKGQKLTFIDTPGHEAFTEMRARGAQITDVVILVVAADDGVMPQTVEAINHARAAGVPMVVAINKVDRPEANTTRVLQQLATHDLQPEQWGGELGCVEVSATTGQGLEELIERTVLEAELLELRANPDRKAMGVVLESRMEEGLGVVANIIVQAGSLHNGDILVYGSAYGRARTITNPRGELVQEALPSDPVSVSGLDRPPHAGDRFFVVDEIETAREIAEERVQQLKSLKLKPRRHITLENLFESLAQGDEQKFLRAVLKADVQGSLDPLVRSIGSLGDETIAVQFLHQGVGDVNESDVLLADASDALVLAFRVDVDYGARQMAAARGVQILTYNVIYEVVQNIRDALEGMLSPKIWEEKIGLAEVRQLFHISRLGVIAGCYVREGSIRRGCKLRVLRNGGPMHEGPIASLRRERDDVREVESGYECGIKVEGFDNLEAGDLIECLETKTARRTLQ